MYFCFYRHDFDAVIKYCKEKKLLYQRGPELILKPLLIKNINGAYEIYIISSGSLQTAVSAYFACNVCHKAMTTFNGLIAHRQSGSHLEHVNKLVAASVSIEYYGK